MIKIKSADFGMEYLEPYQGLHHILDEEKGFLVWRTGTGGNIEILHIRPFVKGHELFMLQVLINETTPRNAYYVMLEDHEWRLIEKLSEVGFQFHRMEKFKGKKDGFVGAVTHKELKKHLAI